jgi:DNA repair photolyase
MNMGVKMLRKSKGNMYKFITHTFNAIKGECHHGCAYCYMKRWGAQKPAHLDERALRVNLGDGNYIFVGSSIDMFSEKIPNLWIDRVISVCRIFNNKYLFQSKNPKRINAYLQRLPVGSVVGTTIETNRIYHQMGGKAPIPYERAVQMQLIRGYGLQLGLMVSIEPIMDFDLIEMVNMIRKIEPNFVSIGANTRYATRLTEPTSEQVEELINSLKNFTTVIEKDNLKRLYRYGMGQGQISD